MPNSNLIKILAEVLAHMDALGEGVVAQDYAERVGLTLRYRVAEEAWEKESWEACDDLWTVNVCDASGKVLASRRLP